MVEHVFNDDVAGALQISARFLKGQAAGIERGGVELSAELLDCSGDVVVEDVLHHSHSGVVVEGQIDVFMGDEVHRRALKGRAANGETERAISGG